MSRRRGPAPFAGPGLALVVAALAALALTGCSGDDKPTTSTTSTRSAADTLASAKKQLDSAASVHMVISSKQVPDDVNGVLALNGVGTPAPAFRGTVDARVKGLRATITAVSVDDALYLKLPFTNIYAPTDPATYGAPDPAGLFDPNDGLSSLLTKTQNPVYGDQVRSEQEVLQTVTGTLPGTAINDLLKTGQREGTFQVTYGLTAEEQLRTTTVVGPFFGSDPSTYTVRLDRYGEPVEITKP